MKNKRYSIFLRVFICVLASISIFSFLLVSVVFVRDYNNKLKFTEYIIREEVGLVVKTQEQLRLTAKFKEIAQNLWNLKLIEDVVLYDSECKILASMPMNVFINKECKKGTRANSNWIYIDFKDNYSELNIIAVRPNADNVNLISIVLPLVALVLMIAIITTFIALYLMKIYLKNPLKELALHIENLIKNENTEFNEHTEKSLPVNCPQEIEPLFQIIKKIKLDLIKTSNQLVIKTKQAAYSEVAIRIAHDIKSPLAVLNTMLMSEKAKLIPEDVRISIRKEISRIQDIANDLLIKSSVKVNTSSHSKKNIQDNDNKVLNVPLEEIISEKRIFFKDKSNVTIIEDIHGENCYGLFAQIDLPEFKRVMSNIIHNAVESIVKGEGKIVVKLRNVELNKIEVAIKDNGRGIPEEILQKIGNVVVSYGKENSDESGHGFGLYYSKKMIESWGGDLIITSQLNKGTNVKILLPRVSPPSWFVEMIRLDDDQIVVILDDDSEVHQVWKNRFKELNIYTTKIEILHFTNPSGFREWFFYNKSKIEKVICFCDFELIGHKENGLDLIKEQVFDKHQAVLVTNFYEDEAIRKRCRELNVRLIPKTQVGYVPISVSLQNKFSVKESTSLLIALIGVEHVEQEKLISLLAEIKNEYLDFKYFDDINSFNCFIGNMKHISALCLIDMKTYNQIKQNIEENSSFKFYIMLDKNMSHFDLGETNLLSIQYRIREMKLREFIREFVERSV